MKLNIDILQYMKVLYIYMKAKQKTMEERVLLRQTYKPNVVQN